MFKFRIKSSQKAASIASETAPAPIANGSEPDKGSKLKAWCIILADGRCGYIHHYKINGLFGVRPVGFESGLHYPNTSSHWSAEEKMKVPEELALSICEIRGAQKSEIPAMWRPS